MSNNNNNTLLAQKITQLNKQYSIDLMNFRNYISSQYNAIIRSKTTSRNKQNAINSLMVFYNTNVNKLQTKLNADIAQAKIQYAPAVPAVVPAVVPVPAPVPAVPAVVPAALVPAKVTKKSALLIGCNYIGTQYQLNGCLTDVSNLETKIKNQYGFQEIKIMTDETTSLKPTKINIINEITTLLTNSTAGDTLFLAFSGHGTTQKDTNGDEKDGYDEMFVPLDFNCISDDEMKTLFQKHLKTDVTLFCLFDCCHSGTILDLKYQYLDSMNYDEATQNSKDTEMTGQVFLLSGCMDNQTSADAYINNKFQGAMTWALLDTLNKKATPTWKDLVTTMRATLKTSQYNQLPQLSSGKAFDINTPFCFA